MERQLTNWEIDCPSFCHCGSRLHYINKDEGRLTLQCHNRLVHSHDKRNILVSIFNANMREDQKGRGSRVKALVDYYNINNIERIKP